MCSWEGNAKPVVILLSDSQLPLLGRDWLCKLRLNWPKMLSSLVDGDPRSVREGPGASERDQGKHWA